MTTDPESVYRFIQLTNRTPVLTAVQGAYPDFASNVPAHWIRYYEVALNPDTQPMLTFSQSDLVNPHINAMLANVLTGQQAVGPALADLHRQVSAILAGAN